MPRLLFVSHHFPPDTTIGSKRCRRIAAALSERRWDVEVLAAREPYMDGNDPALMTGLEAVSIVRSHAVNPRSWARTAGRTATDAMELFTSERPHKTDEIAAREGVSSGTSSVSRDGAKGGEAKGGEAMRGAARSVAMKLVGPWLWAMKQLEVPDRYVGWCLPAIAAGVQLPKPDVILVTVPWFSNLLVGAALARYFGRPMVCDYRDPWNPRERRADLSPWRVELEHAMEQWSLQPVTQVTTTTPGLADELRAVTNAPVSVVFNAAEPGDFLNATPLPYDKPTLLYTGGLYGGRKIEPLLDAMQREPRFNLHYMGSCDGPTRAAVRARSLTDRCTIDGSQPFATAAAAMLGATANVCIVGPEHVRQIPGKLFEQLACGRPLLLLGPPGSDAERVVAGLAGVTTADLGDVDAISRALKALDERTRPIGAPPGFSVSETIDVLESALFSAIP